MVCGVCGSDKHTRSSCSNVFAREILNEIVDASFTQVLRALPATKIPQILNRFLLGTHPRVGEKSPIQYLAGQDDVIKLILSNVSVETSILEPARDHNTRNSIVDKSWEFYSNHQHFTVSPYFDPDTNLLYMCQCQASIAVYPAYNAPFYKSCKILTHFIGKTEIRWIGVKNSYCFTLNCEDILKCYDHTFKNMKWRAFICDGVFNDLPVIYKDLIIVASRFSSRLVAINIYTGNTEWKTDDYGGIHATFPHIYSYPEEPSLSSSVERTDRVWVATKEKIRIFNSSDGSFLTSIDFDGILHRNMCFRKDTFYGCDANMNIMAITVKKQKNSFATSTLPIIKNVSSDVAPLYDKKHNSLIVATTDNHLISYDLSKKVKKIRWKVSLRSNVVAPPAISQTGDYIYIGALSKQVFKIRLEDGYLMWKYKTKGSIEDPIYISSTNVVVSTRKSNLVYLLK